MFTYELNSSLRVQADSFVKYVAPLNLTSAERRIQIKIPCASRVAMSRSVEHLASRIRRARRIGV